MFKVSLLFVHKIEKAYLSGTPNCSPLSALL